MRKNSKPYDLEERTERFARRVRAFIRRLPRILTNIDDARQPGRASGSIGANYIEANESLSPKDFRLRVKISRKEAKECRYWQRLIYIGDDPALLEECGDLQQEASELLKILSSILRKASTN